MATLTLNTAKAFPTAEGAGCLATGARASGANRKIGFITSIAGPTTGSLLGTFNGVNVYTGNMKYLMSLQDIFIIPRTSGRPNQKDEDEGNDITKSWHLFGNNITYLGMLGPKDNIHHDIKLRFGSEGSLSAARNTGQSNLIIRGMKGYLSNPPIGTTTTGNYGRTAVSIFNSNNLIFDSCCFAYGGDQVFDISAQFDAATGVTPKYTGEFTMQNCIIGNGYGTGSLQGSNNNTAPSSTKYTNTKNLWINISHRMPNTRATTLNPEQEYHTYNQLIYNWYGVRTSNFVPNEYIYWVNNVNIPGPNTGGTPLNRMFKYDADPLSTADFIEGSGQLYLRGNIVEGLFFYSLDNKTLVQYYQSESIPAIGGGNKTVTKDITVDDIEFTTEERTPPNYYYLIDTSINNGQLVKQHILNYAGSRWATDGSGNRISDIDSLFQLWINDVNNNTNTSMPAGLTTDSTANEIIPILNQGALYTDSNNNGIADSFETAHGLPADPFAVKTTWNFTDQGGYTVINNAGYTNLEMYSFWINNDFKQLLDRGNITTDNTYTVSGASIVEPVTISLNTVEPTQINLTWTNINPIHKIYRNDVLIDTIGAVGTYNATGLTANTQYTFKVVANDGVNDSIDSNIITVKTLRTTRAGSLANYEDNTSPFRKNGTVRGFLDLSLSDTFTTNLVDGFGTFTLEKSKPNSTNSYAYKNLTNGIVVGTKIKIYLNAKQITGTGAYITTINTEEVINIPITSTMTEYEFEVTPTSSSVQVRVILNNAIGDRIELNEIDYEEVTVTPPPVTPDETTIKLPSIVASQNSNVVILNVANLTYDIQLINTLDEIVIDTNLLATNNKLPINLNTIPIGLYILVITQPSGQISLTKLRIK